MFILYAGSLCFLFIVGPAPCGLVACEGFLVRGACICVLVDGAGSLLSGVVFLALELVGSWVELGFSVGVEAFG